MQYNKSVRESQTMRSRSLLFLHIEKSTDFCQNTPMDEDRLTKDEKKKLRQEEWKKELNTAQRTKIRNRILTWTTGAAILAFAVWFLITIVNQPSSTGPDTSIKLPAITKSDFTSGPADAKLQLVEYADFQCPSCKAYYPIIKLLQKDFEGKLLFVYRFFPLSNIHKNADNAAEAAYAANTQGKFWEMHDLLFENQTTWAETTTARDTFTTYAQQLGLDMTQFKKDFNDPKTEKVAKDAEQKAIDLGLSGTPTFFVNGKIITNPNSYEDFKKLLSDQLNSK